MAASIAREETKAADVVLQPDLTGVTGSRISPRAGAHRGGRASRARRAAGDRTIDRAEECAEGRAGTRRGRRAALTTQPATQAANAAHVAEKPITSRSGCEAIRNSPPNASRGGSSARPEVVDDERHEKQICDGEKTGRSERRERPASEPSRDQLRRRHQYEPPAIVHAPGATTAAIWKR